MIAATRPSSRVAQIFNAFAPQTCRLGSLDDEELVRLAQILTGSQPTDQMLKALSEVRGNPFLASLIATGSDPAAPSQSGAELLRSLAVRLDPEHRTFLELAAMGGREIDVDTLAAAASASLADVVNRVRECQRLGWLASDGESVRFRHDLLVEALVAELPVNERDQTHLRLGRAVAEVGHSPGRAAYHLDAASYLLTVDDVRLLRPVVRALPADDPIVLTLARRAHDLDPDDPEFLCVLMRCLTVRHRYRSSLGYFDRWLARRPVHGRQAAFESPQHPR